VTFFFGNGKNENGDAGSEGPSAAFIAIIWFSGAGERHAS